jgi:hypothetical protein
MRILKARRWFALPVALLAFGLFANHRTNQAWDRMIATGVDLERGLEETNWSRPVLYGKPVEGLAREQYKQVGNLLSEKAHEEWIECRTAQLKQEPGALKLRDVLINSNRLMLQALARGAHRTDARPHLDFDKAFGHQTAKLLEGRSVVNIAVLAAEQQLDHGHPQAAAELLLDAMQYGRDLMHGPNHISTMIGCAFVAISTKEALLNDSGCEHMLDRFPPQQLQVLAHGLRTLEESIQLGAIAADGELAYFIEAIAACESEVSNGDDYAALITKYANYGPAGRVLAIDYVMETLQIRNFMVEADGQPWTELWKNSMDFAEDDSSLNPLTHHRAVILPSVFTTRRGTTTLIRLARTAVNYRLTGEDPGLSDPFGTSFQWHESEDNLEVRSVGPNPEVQRGNYSIRLH